MLSLKLIHQHMSEIRADTSKRWASRLRREHSPLAQLDVFCWHVTRATEGGKFVAVPGLKTDVFQEPKVCSLQDAIDVSCDGT